MRALVLAAGCGERLRPLTTDRPKPMIAIGGVPIVQRNIELLAAAGIREIAVNLHYRPDDIREYFGDGSALGVRLQYAYEPQLLGTAGAIANLTTWLGRDDFLIVYGDNVSNIDLRKLVAAHASARADLTIALYERDDVSESGVAVLGNGDRIVRFVEKPRDRSLTSRWVNAGYLVARTNVIAAIGDGRPADIGRDLIPALLERGAHVRGYRMSESLWWIDSPADYERTKEAFERV